MNLAEINLTELELETNSGIGTKLVELKLEGNLLNLAEIKFQRIEPG